MDDILKMCERNIQQLLEIYSKEKEQQKKTGVLYLTSDGEKVDVLYLTKDLLPEGGEVPEYFKNADKNILFLLHDTKNNEKQILNITQREGVPPSNAQSIPEKK